MTWKLSFISVKKRWQDYVVLLAGLVISVAIFFNDSTGVKANPITYSSKHLRLY